MPFRSKIIFFKTISTVAGGPGNNDTRYQRSDIMKTETMGIPCPGVYEPRSVIVACSETVSNSVGEAKREGILTAAIKERGIGDPTNIIASRNRIR